MKTISAVLTGREQAAGAPPRTVQGQEPKMSKRLELVWPHKDEVLLGLDSRGNPVWGSKDDLEPRLLWQLEVVGVETDRP